MNDRTRLKFRATLVYDAETMHSGDRDVESRGWFLTEVLGGEHLCLHDNGELGDAIGSVEDFELVQDVDAAELRARIQNIIHVLEKKPIHWLHSPDALVQTVDELRAALAATEEDA